MAYFTEAERLKGFKIYVSENHEQISKRQYNAQQDNLCYEDKSKGNPSVFQNVSCVKAMAGKYVTIFNSRNGPEAFLELCEVEIYGCIVGTYGPDCRKRCSENCSDRRCNPNSGKCNKCYRTSKFGFDCSHRCPDNCRNNQCDGGSGKCESCKTNYHGFNCTEQCIGCLNGLCYQDSGTCANKTGCKEGFFGIRGSDLICNQSCVSLNCKICDIETGRCKELSIVLLQKTQDDLLMENRKDSISVMNSSFLKTTISILEIKQDTITIHIFVFLK
ncbi:hypothetical protein KUTeg_008119 [Tegillarca granosa]|uniref:Uncharacterized protein n=1 Tax=Tegillarca granosa TaxID=220873 RepID=A0ABQ9FD10_TEGGR|nr:hypothetical protein KUTeg_008119 [Tegillarca granosa]